MKTLKHWAQELPKAFREALHQDRLEESKTAPSTMVSAIAYLNWEDIVKHKTEDEWSLLRAKYFEEPPTEHHVVYWFAEGDSRGCTVQAFDVHHAADIMEAKFDVPLDQIIYLHAKESVFKPKKVLN